MTKNEFRKAYRRARLVFAFEEDTGVAVDSLRLSIPDAVRSPCYRYGDRLVSSIRVRRTLSVRYVGRDAIIGPVGVLPA